MSVAAAEERDEDEVPALATAAAETAESNDKRRARWGCALYAALAVMIPTLIVGTVCFWFYLQDRILAQEALARARAAGDPLTKEEFQAAFYPPSPETDEVTRRWIAAIEAIRRLYANPLTKDMPDTGTYGPPGPPSAQPARDARGLYAEPTLSTVDGIFAGAGEEAVAAIQAARRAGVPPRIACDVSGEQELALESNGILCVSSPLLILEAERKAAHGDLDAATEALESMIAMSDACVGDVSIHGIAGRAESYRWACRTVRQITERVDLSDAQLARLDEALSNADFREEFVRYVQAEQYRIVRAIETDEPTDDEALELFRDAPLRGADEAMAVENCQELLEGAKVDLESAQAACDRVSARMASIEGMVDQIWYQIAVWRAQEIDPRLCLVLQAEADRRLTRTLVACERYRLKHGSWPADVESLAPEFLEEVPQDVLGGKPISLVVEGDRLKLGSTVSENPSRAYPPAVDRGPVEATIEKPSATTDAATP